MTTKNRVEDIAQRITKFFENEFPNPDCQLTPTTHLLQDWLVDSFSIVNVILFLEQSFGVRVQESDIRAENFQTILTLTQFVAAQLGPADNSAWQG
ncbi:MAG: acyl carrier protein [Nitrospinaceae bacterium]